MLKEGYDMDPNEGQEELEEVQAELKKKEAEVGLNSLEMIWVLLNLLYILSGARTDLSDNLLVKMCTCIWFVSAMLSYCVKFFP